MRSDVTTRDYFYVGPVPVAPGQTVTWRAVDVNGNVEATQSLTG